MFRNKRRTIIAGIAIGMLLGRKQKTWSELTPEEKKTRIMTIAAGGVLFIAGVIVFLVRLLS